VKFRRFLARHFPGFRLLPMSGVPGARQRVLMQIRDRPVAPYCGPFEEHVLLLVREGTITFEWDGRFLTADSSDALLIGRGESGRLTFHIDPDTSGITVEIMTFDERAIARSLRHAAGLESLVLLKEPNSTTALCFRGLDRRIPSNLPLPSHRFHAAISTVFSQYSVGLFAFLRDHFYEHRWKLCLLLEGLVTFPEALKDAAVQYAGGSAKLRRDCLLYIGVKPEVFLTRRHCELASAWLRCGHSIEEVAKALGFSSKWEFECVFAGSMKKRCADVQKLPPLDDVQPEQLVEAIQPFWWNGRKLTMAEIPQERMFPPSIMNQALEDRIVANEPDMQTLREQNRQERTELIGELRTKAVDFFAMKSTGTNLIVPIFKPSQDTAKAA
jgi:AraC-like DNA-binding protein